MHSVLLVEQLSQYSLIALFQSVAALASPVARYSVLADIIVWYLSSQDCSPPQIGAAKRVTKMAGARR